MGMALQGPHWLQARWGSHRRCELDLCHDGRASYGGTDGKRRDRNTPKVQGTSFSQRLPQRHVDPRHTVARRGVRRHDGVASPSVRPQAEGIPTRGTRQLPPDTRLDGKEQEWSTSPCVKVFRDPDSKNLEALLHYHTK